MSKKPSLKPSKKKSKGGSDITKPNIKRVSVADIIVAEKDFRPLDDKTVKDLVESFAEVGLMHPPTVYIKKPKDESDSKEIHLVAGHHRLTAAKTAGWEYIDVIVVERNKEKNLMRQTTENLHRSSLTKLQQGKEIKKWLEMHLAKEDGQVAQPNDKRISAAAKQFDKSRRTIKRLIEAGAIEPKAALALKEAKLDDNGQILDQVAHEKPEKQAARVERIVRDRAKKPPNRKGKGGAENGGKDKGNSPKTGSSGRNAKTLATGGTDDAPYDKLMAAWNDAPDFRKAWEEAEEEDRQDFIDDVLMSEEDEIADDTDSDDE